MFEVGFSEILVISIMALVVLGPTKLPRLAAQVGRWMGRARAMAQQFRQQLEDEVSFEDKPERWRPSPPASEPPPATSSHPIDSNDTGHSDLSQTSADSITDAPVNTPATDPSHERGS